MEKKLTYKVGVLSVNVMVRGIERFAAPQVMMRHLGRSLALHLLGKLDIPTLHKPEMIKFQ